MKTFLILFILGSLVSCASNVRLVEGDTGTFDPDKVDIYPSEAPSRFK